MSLRRDRHAGAVDDEHARARAEPRRGDHVVHEAEIEARDEHAHQLAGAAARLDDEADDRLVRRRTRIADVAAEAVRADVDAGRHRIAVAAACRRDRGSTSACDNRHVAAQPAQRAAGSRARRRRVGPLRRRRARRCAARPGACRRARRRARGCGRARRAATSSLDVVRARANREHADDDRRHDRGQREHERARASATSRHGARHWRQPGDASRAARRDRLVGVASPATTAASAGLRSSNNSGVTARARQQLGRRERGVASRWHERRRAASSAAAASAPSRTPREAELDRADVSSLASRQPSSGCFAHAGHDEQLAAARRVRERADRDAIAVAEAAELPRPGDPVRDLVRVPAAQLVGRLAARAAAAAARARRTAPRSSVAARAPRRRRRSPARRELAALGAQPRHEPVAVDAHAERKRHGSACARRARRRRDRRRAATRARARERRARRRARRRSAAAPHRAACAGRARPPRASSRASRALRARARADLRARARAATSRRCGSGRGSCVAGAQDLADHLLAARERHERRLDASPRSRHRRVEQLGLARRRTCAGSGSRRSVRGSPPPRSREHSASTSTSNPHGAHCTCDSRAMRSMTGFGRGVGRARRRARDGRSPRGQPPVPRSQAARARCAGRSRMRSGADPRRRRARRRRGLGSHRAGGTAAALALDQPRPSARTASSPRSRPTRGRQPDLALVLAQPGVVRRRRRGVAAGIDEAADPCCRRPPP